MKNNKKKKSREANYRDVTLIVKFSTNLVDYFQLTCSFQRYVLLAVLQSQNNPIHMAKFEFVNDSPSHRLVFYGVILIQGGESIVSIYLLVIES